MSLRALSLCSGIEAASVAASPLGWRFVAFSEIEAFPSAVLAHHYPDVPNHGDMLAADWSVYRGHVDIVVGGTPCQAFSVAGLRGGLTDARGDLTMQFVKACDDIEPAYVLWENVPGVLSDRSNAFGCFLGALCGESDRLEPPGGRWFDAGYVLGPTRAIAWRVLDAQYFGLAQRRRRVFVVACPVDGGDPRQILFECDGVRPDLAPSRETGASVAGALGGIPPGGDWRVGGDEAAAGQLVALTCADRGMLVNQAAAGMAIPVLAHALRADGFDASEDGTGRGTPLVPVFAHAFDARQQDVIQYGDMTGPLDTDGTSIAVAYGIGSDAIDRSGEGKNGTAAERSGLNIVIDMQPTIRARPTNSVAYAFAENSRAEVRLEGGDRQTTSSLKTGGGKAGQSYPAIAAGMRVRRLTPMECERLQGFPDGYTDVPFRGKPAADGPRYKALGNSWAVPSVRWIFARITADWLVGE